MNAERRPSAPRPAPEKIRSRRIVEKAPADLPPTEFDPIAKLAERKARIDALKDLRRPLYEGLWRESQVISDVQGQLGGLSEFLLRELEVRMVDEASQVLVPAFRTRGGTSPKELFADIGVESLAFGKNAKPETKGRIGGDLAGTIFEAPKTKKKKKLSGLLADSFDEPVKRDSRRKKEETSKPKSKSLRAIIAGIQWENDSLRKGKREVLFKDSRRTYRGKLGFVARSLHENRTVRASYLKSLIGTDISGKITELRVKGWKISTRVDRKNGETFYTRISSPRGGR